VTKRLILLGGAAGAGKSTTARALARELDAGWLQLDTIWVALHGVFPPDSPESQLLRVDERVRDRQDPVEAIVEHHIETSRFVCRALPGALEFELQSHETLVADGSWILPGFVAGLSMPGATVSAMLIHEPDIHEVRIAMDSRKETKMVAPWDARSVEVSWRYGNWLASEATKHRLPVVLARPRETLLERARAILGASAEPSV